MKKVRRFFSLYWQTILSALAILIVVAGLLGFRLGKLTPGLSSSELAFIENASSIENISANPLFAPMKLPILGLQHIGVDRVAAYRGVGAVFGIVTVLLFYFLLRRWHTRRVALLTSFLFIVSSWFLQVSRLALPYVLFAFGVALLMTVAANIHDKHASKLSLLLATVSLATILYIPAMAWFILILLIWRPSAIKSGFGQTPNVLKVVGVLFFIVLVAPLAYALVRDPTLVGEWLGLPTELIPLEWVRRILVLPIFLTAQGPLEPVYNLGRLPLLDVFTTVLVILGIYSYYFKAKLLRTQMFGLLAIVATMLIAFNGPTFLSLLLPIVFIIAAAGLTLLLQQWFTVFPNNPIARSIGVITIAVVISITGVYHARRYFVAWAGNPDTRGEFIYPLDNS